MAERSVSTLGGRVGKAIDLGVDFLAQIGPDILWHGEKYLDHVGIELASGPALNFFPRRGHGLRFAIRAGRK